MSQTTDLSYALAKITAVLPSDLRINVESSPLLVGPHELIPIHHVDLSLIRHAIRREKKLDITYCDVNDSQSSRVIWPFALGFFEQVRIVVAWCEWRQQFRHFRADRILVPRLLNKQITWQAASHYMSI